MPMNRIEGVRIAGPPPKAPPDAVTIGFVVSLPPSIADSPRNVRVRWEVEVAAAAIRDGFARLGLRRVVAFRFEERGAEPDDRRVVGIALPAWGVPRWKTSPPPATLGRGASTWAHLQARLDALSRRWRVRTHLERYNPFGKAPVVTLTTAEPGDFIRKGGFHEYLAALRFGEPVYDGVFIHLDGGGGVLQKFATYRGRQSEGCLVLGRIPYAARVCDFP